MLPLMEHFKGKVSMKNAPIPLISDLSLNGLAVYKGKDWLEGTWGDGIVLEDTSCIQKCPLLEWIDMIIPTLMNSSYGQL